MGSRRTQAAKEEYVGSIKSNALQVPHDPATMLRDEYFGIFSAQARATLVSRGQTSIFTGRLSLTV